MNENYAMPILPMGSTEGMCRGIYKLSQRNLGPNAAKVRLFGSGAILRESLRAQDLLDKHFGVSGAVYSVTSYKALYMDGRDKDHWNRLHPQETQRKPYVAEVLEADAGPIVAASDYVSTVPLSISSWVGPDYTVLGHRWFWAERGTPRTPLFFRGRRRKHRPCGPLSIGRKRAISQG